MQRNRRNGANALDQWFKDLLPDGTKLGEAAAAAGITLPVLSHYMAGDSSTEMSRQQVWALFAFAGVTVGDALRGLLWSLGLTQSALVVKLGAMVEAEHWPGDMRSAINKALRGERATHPNANKAVIDARLWDVYRCLRAIGLARRPVRQETLPETAEPTGLGSAPDSIMDAAREKLAEARLDVERLETLLREAKTGEQKWETVVAALDSLQ